jgi:hypothetical protein
MGQPAIPSLFPAHPQNPHSVGRLWEWAKAAKAIRLGFSEELMKTKSSFRKGRWL